MSKIRTYEKDNWKMKRKCRYIKTSEIKVETQRQITKTNEWEGSSH